MCDVSAPRGLWSWSTAAASFPPTPTARSTWRRSPTLSSSGSRSLPAAPPPFMVPTPSPARPTSSSRTISKGSRPVINRSEEHTSELHALMRNSYAVLCLKKQKQQKDKATNSKQNKKTKIVRDNPKKSKITAKKTTNDHTSDKHNTDQNEKNENMIYKTILTNNHYNKHDTRPQYTH